MIEIKDLLGRFRNILLSGEVNKEIVSEIVHQIAGISIQKEKIVIKNGVIYLDIKPIYKNEVFLKKDQIFSELEKRLGKKSPKSFQ